MITEKTIDACKNDEIKIAGDPPRPTKKGLMKIPHSISIIGAKGKGKTNCMVRLFRAYQKGRIPAFDHDNVFMISPTAYLDAKAQLLRTNEENTYDSTENLDEALQDIIEKIEESLEEWDDYQDRMEAWRMFSNWDDPMSLFPADALLKIFNPVTQEIHKPTTKYPARPSSLIILDDQAGTGFLSDNTGNSALTNFIIKSRHFNTSVWITSQHYTNIARAIRGNASCLIIFKTQDEKVLDEVAREVGGDVAKDKFKKLYKHATAKPYNFLLIDLANTENKYRRNFDRVLQI